MMRETKTAWRLIPYSLRYVQTSLIGYVVIVVIGIVALGVFAAGSARTESVLMNTMAFFGPYFMLIGMLMFVMQAFSFEIPYMVQASPIRKRLYRGITGLYAVSLGAFYLVLILVLSLFYLIFPVAPEFARQIITGSFFTVITLSLYIAFSYKRRVLAFLFLMVAISIMNGMIAIPYDRLASLVGWGNVQGVPMPGAFIFALVSVAVNTVLFSFYLKVTYRMSFSPRVYDTLK